MLFYIFGFELNIIPYFMVFNTGIFHVHNHQELVCMYMYVDIFLNV